ncbi:hypothetical protein CM15mP35_05730 [bacterium]|nr:MAG: hypothetical protein CM15mP35_05730 [bacterium]
MLIGLIFYKPANILISKIRKKAEESRIISYELDDDQERILSNFYLIKLLSKENEEYQRFSNSVDFAGKTRSGILNWDLCPIMFSHLQLHF